MPALMDENVVSLVKDLKARYRLGLPVMAPTEDERPLRPDEVVNRDLDLGPYEHPVVLTLIASKDPLNATALAASSRLVAAAAAQRSLVASLAMLAGEITQHKDVRIGLGIAQKHAFSPDIAAHLGEIALERVDAERDRAFHSLVDLLKKLNHGGEPPANFLCELLRLGYASDLRRDTLKTMLSAIFASPQLRPMILPTMAETLRHFPRDLLIGVASEVNKMNGDPDMPFLRREMQVALAAKEKVRNPTAASAASVQPKVDPAPAVQAPAQRKPEIRPWMPMIQKASQIRARRAAVAH